jgi:hypothetical protein
LSANGQSLRLFVQETPDDSNIIVQLDPVACLQVSEWFAGPTPAVHLKDPQALAPLGILSL